MLAESIRDLIRGGESETVEFKLAVPSTQSLARTFAAFANAKGGVLLLGVEDHPNSRPIGVDADHAEIAVMRAADSLMPTPEIRTSRVTIDGLEVVAVEVTATRHLTLAPDGLFVRVGDAIRPFTPAEAVERLSSHEDQDVDTDAENLVQAVAALTEQLDTQRPLLESLTKANRWHRKLLWVVLGAAAGGSSKELMDFLPF